MSVKYLFNLFKFFSFSIFNYRVLWRRLSDDDICPKDTFNIDLTIIQIVLSISVHTIYVANRDDFDFFLQTILNCVISRIPVICLRF